MDAEKIIQELNRRFAAPLPEFYKRRIIFWYDEDREFEDKLDEIQIEGAKIIALTGNNNFHVKKLLNIDDPAGNYLVYSPLSHENPAENWLLDAELYSEDFHADLISMWMDEMGLPQSADLRRGLKTYRKFFNAKTRRSKLADLGTVQAKMPQLQLSIMAVLAGTKDTAPDAIMKAVLRSGLNAEENPIYREFINYEIDEAFWGMAAQGTGYQDENPDLKHLSAHLLLSAATRTMRPEFFSGLDAYISMPHQAFCYDFVSDWMHSGDNPDLKTIAEDLETELKLPSRFMKLDVNDLLETEIFPCIHEVILVKLMTEISDHIIDIDVITKAVEKRRTCVWYNDVKNYYEGILFTARMQDFFKKHATGFHAIKPQEVWEAYTRKYYIMDTWYRQFHKLYSESLKNYHEDLSDLFVHVKDKVEGLYTNWFLGELGSNWADAFAEDLAAYGYIRENDIKRQYNFYWEKVEVPNSRVYVIISDGMRYEVAVELAELLRRETQSEVELSSMQGIFPAITKFGMAALLPHKKLSVELKQGKTERIAVLADDQSTEMPNRDKVLKAKNPKSVALQYKNIIGMKRAERQALVKGMDIVYIYHDVIDEAGHSEKSVFSACDDAIQELMNLVRIICNEFSGTKILITSDHGFLYTHSPLKEDDKVDKTTESDQDIEIGRRYAIMKKGAQPQYLLPVKFMDGNTDYDAFTPRESIRIKMKGGGLNYVHGGISPQEFVVPLIDFHYLRSDSKEYQRNKSKYDTKPVEIGLLSANRKISNMIFSLNFYQKEPVSGNREAALYQVYFTDSSGKTISDIAKIIADKTSSNEQDRIFRSSFNLKSLKYSSTETYYLVIADENGMQLQREEFQIDIAFAVDEFDFFS